MFLPPRLRDLLHGCSRHRCADAVQIALGTGLKNCTQICAGGLSSARLANFGPRGWPLSSRAQMLADGAARGGRRSVFQVQRLTPPG